MVKKLTLEEVKTFIETNSDCKLISNKYLNSRSKIRILCNCGNEFEKTFNNFRSGQRQCNTCRNRIFWDIEKINQFVKENSDCRLVSKYYVDTETKLTFQCKCGNIFITKWAEFLRGNKKQCNDCGLKNRINLRSKDNECFVKEVFELVQYEYEILSEYKRSQSHVKFKHNKCGNIFLMFPNSFLRGQRCPKCNKPPTKTTDSFKQEIYSLVGNEYTMLGEYKNNRTKTLIKHNKCNYNWEVRPDDFLRGNRCPKCRNTKGERIISAWLDKYNIDYKEQYRIKECRNKRPLPFDFAIFENNKLKLLIEYDGLLHFKQTTLNNDLNTQKLHDEIKNNFCKENNIKLLRIPYWKFKNIDNMLESALK